VVRRGVRGRGGEGAVVVDAEEKRAGCGHVKQWRNGRYLKMMAVPRVGPQLTGFESG